LESDYQKMNKGDGKIAILGAGNVGSTTAAILAGKIKNRICLYDKLHGLAVGKAMDISQACLSGCCTEAKEVPEAIEGAEVIVISAGLPRAKGQVRADLFNSNSEILLDLGKTIMKVAPEAVVLIVTNPVDALTTVFNREFPELRAYGMGCTLDAQRYRHFISQQASVSAELIDALVIGSHNKNMVALTSLATIDGRPAREILTEQQLDEAEQKTRNAGTVISS
jgi:malate dehydrogenase